MSSLTTLLGKLANLIINPIIILGFVVAVIVFFIGIIQFIAKADSDADRAQGKKTIVYGLIGLFIMFSVYGILHFVLNTFQINYSNTAGKVLGN